MAEIKAIAFDFDGVLGDTVKAHTQSRIEAFRELGYDVDPVLHEEAHRHGSHPPEIIGWLLKQAGFVSSNANVMHDSTVQRVVKLKNQLYREHAAAGLDAIPGAVEFSVWAEQRYTANKLAIATTASREHEVEPFLRRHNLENNFGIIIGSELTPEGRTKPDSYVYEVAVRQLGFEPGNVLGIEDSPRGITSAKGAELYVAGLTTTHSHDDLSQSNKVFDTFDEIKNYIEAA